MTIFQIIRLLVHPHMGGEKNSGELTSRFTPTHVGKFR